MKIIAIKKMSAGNESVGEMWDETQIFTPDQTIMEVMKWVGTRKAVVLTVPTDDEDQLAAAIDADKKAEDIPF